jgi:hypothetical protein
MFLKFVDNLELRREDEAKLAGRKFKPAPTAVSLARELAT